MSKCTEEPQIWPVRALALLKPLLEVGRAPRGTIHGLPSTL